MGMKVEIGAEVSLEDGCIRLELIGVADGRGAPQLHGLDVLATQAVEEVRQADGAIHACDIQKLRAMANALSHAADQLLQAIRDEEARQRPAQGLRLVESRFG